MKVLFSIFSVVTAVTLSAAHPFGLRENQPYGIISSDYVTQHVKWAKPFAGGKIKIFVMAPTLTQRETVELAQRLDVDYTVWMSKGFHILQTPPTTDWCGLYFRGPDTVIAEALEKGMAKEHDVYVVGKMDWDYLPPKTQLEILRRVSAGAGIVFINPVKEHKHHQIIKKQKALDTSFITSAMPATLIPGFNDWKTTVNAYAFGKGRVVFMDYGEKVSLRNAYHGYGGKDNTNALVPDWKSHQVLKSKFNAESPKVSWNRYDFESLIYEVGFEYGMAQVARAVIFAAGKNAADFTVNVPKKVKAGTAAPFTVNGKYKAVVRSASAYSKQMNLGSAKKLPALPAGDWILDVWQLDDSNRIINWKSISFQAESPVEIADITLNKTIHKPLEKVTGKITFSAPVKQGEVQVRMFDNLGRLVAKAGKVKVSADSATFELQPEMVDVTLHRIEARVIRGAKVLAEKDRYFPVQYFRLRRFVDVIWGNTWNTALTHLNMRRMAEEDAVDIMLLPWSYAPSVHNTTRYNMGVLAYPARYGHLVGDKNHIVRRRPGDGGCLFDPFTLKMRDKEWQGFSDTFTAYAPVGYTMGDETIYSKDKDICFCQYCLVELRKFLKTQYKDIQELNKYYKTAYKSFDEVVPLTFQQSLDAKNYSSWIDHRRMASITLAKHYKAAQNFFRSKGDTTSHVGYDGIQGNTSANQGCDIPPLMDHMDLLNVYNYGNTATARMLGDFAPKGSLCGAWYGSYGESNTISYNTAEFCHNFPYETLFNGLRASWFWVVSSPGSVSGYAADLTPLPYFAARTKSLKEIRTGIADLILDATPEDDPILVVYSDPSRIANSLFMNSKKQYSGEEFVDSLNSIDTALEDSGFSYRYIVPDDLKKQIKNAKVVVLPYVILLNDADAELLRDFVKNGGIVVSNVVPGKLGDHGAIREKPFLADVFPAEKGIKAYGKGYFIQLGSKLLHKYRETRGHDSSWQQRMPLAGLELGKMLAQAGYTPRVKLSPANPKQQVPPTYRYGFRNGNVHYIGLLRDFYLHDTAAYKMNLTLPVSGHVYEVRTNRYLGKVSKLTYTQDWHVNLFAVLPAKVTGVAVNVPSAAKPGSKVKVSAQLRVTDGKMPSAGAYMLTVKDPSGKLLKEHERTLSAVNGKASAEFTFAYNQKKGKYTVIFRDTVSGITGSAKIEVK